MSFVWRSKPDTAGGMTRQSRDCLECNLVVGVAVITRCPYYRNMYSLPYVARPVYVPDTD